MLLAGCSSITGSLPADLGKWTFNEGAAQMVVPALWAGTDAEGMPVGGVEPAEIEVSTAGVTPEYRVDLADIQAEGAGPAWQAATAIASAFATVFVGADPASVDLAFTVTGPIDGPSAGGILTVGLIAAFLGDSLEPGVTMTGTIAEGELGIGRFLPQALAVVESLDTDEGVDCSQVSEHLSDYSRFLVQAAQASEVYLQDVMGARLENLDATRMLEYVTSAVSARELSRDVTQETDDYPAEAEQFSKALTYFWLTSYVIAATQAYNLRSDPLTGDVVPNNPDSMNAAIAQTWWFINVRNDLIKAGGLDPSAAAWSANWALQAALDNAGGEYATQAGWLAQGELWYDAVQTTAMLSYLDPTVVESPMPSDER